MLGSTHLTLTLTQTHGSLTEHIIVSKNLKVFKARLDK
jgi:hypothetical protein